MLMTVSTAFITKLVVFIYLGIYIVVNGCAAVAEGNACITISYTILVIC